jgi:UPF0755 protein
MIKKILKACGRTWFTGALYLLASAGYSFYAVLWAIRFMQTTKRLFIFIFTGSLLLLAAAVYLFVPLHRSQTAIEFTVEKGSSLRSISRMLAKQGVVPSSTAFILWMKVRGEESKIQAGKFTVFKGEGIVSASVKLLHATPVEATVTIPEGLTIEQTAGIISRAFHCDSSEFVRECQDTAVLREHGIAAASCEGYLFPDTYRFPPDAISIDIIRRMTAHFEEMTSTLPPPVPRPTAPALSKQEYVVLASIIEREAELASERQHISGIFHNRLEKKIPLGADPTIRYALRKFDGPLLVSELSKDTPYNTRLHAGLPPGPICSPGLASLAAAMAPDQTKDLYFVAKWDGSGAHDFSMTNEEHTRKKMEIRRMNDLRKIGAIRLSDRKSVV